MLAMWVLNHENNHLQNEKGICRKFWFMHKMMDLLHNIQDHCNINLICYCHFPPRTSSPTTSFLEIAVWKIMTCGSKNNFASEGNVSKSQLLQINYHIPFYILGFTWCCLKAIFTNLCQSIQNSMHLMETIDWHQLHAKM